MRKRDRRLALALACITLASLATGLIAWALSQSATYFYSPVDIAAMANKPQGRIRIGGLVVANSVVRDQNQHVTFRVSDLEAELEVNYSGILPDLFREGQGIVAEGIFLPSGIFEATQVLAKHDETYMPPEVAKTLKEQGEWRASAAESASDN